MKILLVVPRFTCSPAENYMLPAGLAYIASALKEADREVYGLNLNHSDRPVPELLSEMIQRHSIDAIGVGSLSPHFPLVKHIIDAAHRIKPGIISILGGGLLTSEPELVMDAMSATFGVIGEGEATIVELIDAISAGVSPAGVNGIIYRDAGGKLVRTSPREEISNIDTIPFPDYELFGISEFYKYRFRNEGRESTVTESNRQIYVCASRSCPFKCTFCYHPVGSKYRQRSLDSIFEEIDYLIHKYNPTSLSIIDELFSVDKERIFEFCRRIKKYDLKWQVQMRVVDIDRQILDTMRDAGCFALSYGLESGSDKVLKSMKKHITAKDIETALQVTYDARLHVQGNYIIGDPAEDFDTLTETVDLWLKYHKLSIFFVLIRTFPGADIYKYALDKGLIADKLSYIESQCLPDFHLTSLSNEQYIKAVLLINILSASFGCFPGEIKDCYPTHTQEHVGQMYDVVIKCPHCLEETTYRNMAANGSTMISCQVCYRRFHIPQPGNWKATPINYLLSKHYTYSPEHAQEFHDRLTGWEWPNRDGMAGRLLELFGHSFLVPGSLEMNEAVFRNFSAYYVGSSGGRTFYLPLFAAPGDYRPLNHPLYLGDRVGSLVSEWVAQRKRVILFGPPDQIKILMNHTNILDANIIGMSSPKTEDWAQVSIEIPYINPKIMSISNPDAILITDPHNQDEIAKALAHFEKLNIRVVKLYE